MFREMTEEEMRAIAWPVTINSPRNGGSVREETMLCHFNMIDEDEYAELAEGPDADKEILRRVLVGWGKLNKKDPEKTDQGFYDKDGNHIDFSEEARERLIKLPYARVSIINGYIAMKYGNKSAARKN
ncbi:MAG: hypothetical protein H6937_09030 [Burkholderiales bacterium]|nr:hypothetical protein [Burkholderiales bacterium]MDR4518967.1 hypothetical protein [Nitrosomonas sp.]